MKKSSLAKAGNDPRLGSLTQAMRAYYGSTSDEELADTFNISVSRVRSLAKKLALSKSKVFLAQQKIPTRMPRWSASEIEVLRRIYPQKDSLWVAQRLRRSVKAVVSKAHQLGIHKTYSRLEEMGRQNRSKR